MSGTKTQQTRHLVWWQDECWDRESWVTSRGTLYTTTHARYNTNDITILEIGFVLLDVIFTNHKTASIQPNTN